MSLTDPPVSITFTALPVIGASVPVTGSGPLLVAGQNASGSLRSVLTDDNGAVIVVASGTLAVAIGAPVTIANFPATQTITGSVGINGITFPETVTVSGTVGAVIQNFPVTQGVSGSVGVYTSGLQGISGTVAAVVQNWPVVHGVSGSVNVYTSGPQAVSGTVAAVIQNWPTIHGVSGSVNVYTSGLQGISGTVNIGTAPQLQISNFPATQNVSGTVTIGGFATNVTASVQFAPIPLQVFSVGAAAVSGSVNVYTSGLQGISGTVNIGTAPQLQISNFPATQNVSGTVNIGTAPQLQISNFPATQAVSGTITIGGYAANVTASVQFAPTPLQVFSAGAIGVTGTVSIGSAPQLQISNFPATQNISGTVNIGTAPQLQISNFPATQNVSGTVVVGTWGTNVTASVQFAHTPLQVFSAGAIGVTGTVAITTTVPLQVYNAATVGVSGTVGVNNFPATQNISGTVGAFIQNWPPLQGVSGTVNIGTAPQLQIFNFPATQAVSGTVNITSGTLAAVLKGINTQASAADNALVVALSPASAQTRAATPTITSVVGIATSTTILAANAARLGAIITNSSTAILYLRYGSSAAANSAGNYTIAVPISGGSHEVPYGYTGQITGIWASANGFANITEITV